jgi:hypothetical protein
MTRRSRNSRSCRACSVPSGTGRCTYHGGVRLSLGLALTVFAGAAEYSSPKVLATVSIAELKESSGVVASRAYPGVFWTHNDSGDGPYLYAFDRSGKGLGRWRVAGARALDWEDIAIAPGLRKGEWFLYIGDIGDNNRRRADVIVYRVPEPDPHKAAADTAPSVALRLRYPDGPHDAECLMVHPASGDLYVVTKATSVDPATLVFQIRAPFTTRIRQMNFRRVAEINLPESLLTMLVGRVTGCDISPDGLRVVLCDYLDAWEAELPRGAKKFDDVWSAEWHRIDLGPRKQGEGVAYSADGKRIVATSEGPDFPFIEVTRVTEAQADTK